MIAKCEECGSEFITHDDAKKVCSSKCRQRKYRKSDKAKLKIAEYNLRYKRPEIEWECFRCGGKISSSRKRVFCSGCLELGKSCGYGNPGAVLGMQKWKKENPEKVEVYKKMSALQKNVERGYLEKEPCEVCGMREKIQWHHHSYRTGKEKDVIPLCIRHHHELHSWDSN